MATLRNEKLLQKLARGKSRETKIWRIQIDECEVCHLPSFGLDYCCYVDNENDDDVDVDANVDNDDVDDGVDAASHHEATNLFQEWPDKKEMPRKMLCWNLAREQFGPGFEPETLHSV